MPSLVGQNSATFQEDDTAKPITFRFAGINTFGVATNTAKGTLTGFTSGTFANEIVGTYQPSKDEFGQDSFYLRVTNSLGVVSTLPFNITISEVNDSPVATIPSVLTVAGTNWTERSSVVATNWQAIASSYTGTTLAAVVDGGFIYVSANSGANWGQRATRENWQSIASSESGQNLVAAVDGGRIHTSKNFGETWQQSAPTANWTSVASDKDGTKVLRRCCLGMLWLHRKTA
jgi:hypothetical protein